MKVAYSGAHRTGKTSLAERVAVDMDFVMYYTEVAKVFKTKTVKEAEKLKGEDGFYERVMLQESILDHVLKHIRNGEAFSAFDRSALDVYSYSELFLPKLMQEFTPAPSHFQAFSNHCASVRSYFNAVDFTIIVQPGIKFEDDVEACSLELQESMNDIILNAADYYIPKDKYVVIPRDMVDFEERVVFCKKAIEDRIALRF